ncbi:MAG: LPS export ABC transporter periplasmic protein LptC [Bacteroidetes bacterium]|nr:LPS export ABC transporter periplasmic protein LptC [Bacteroidota bacterium]
MKHLLNIIIKNIAITVVVAMFFACNNNSQKVQDFLSDQNLPIGVAENIKHVYTDSGFVKSKLFAPLLLDFSNRKEHPYSEFPKGLKVISFDANGDSITVSSNYGISYSKTSVTEIKDGVTIENHRQKITLKTQQLFWDQKTHFFYTEKDFILTTVNDTIYGYGFESNEQLTNWNMRRTKGNIYVKDIE